MALFAAALTLGVVFEDGLPEYLIDSNVYWSERPVRLAARVRESWSASRKAQDLQCARGTLTGIVTCVRDGDTIEVRGVPIGLNTIAATRAEQPSGNAGSR